ncbi:MAG TPA: glycosyltransferase family 4 protein [Candidatus Acidoferrum sp.]|nr:glycosyltransferase family 4 protein [Candidatus Acidoferrum sp.]
MAPMLRRMAQHPQLELDVAYCSLRGAQPTHDPEFNTTVQWDIPLFEGYQWQEIANRGSRADSFFGLYNPGLWKLIRNGKFDAVLCYLSYRCASFWISYSASKLSRSAFLFGCDQNSLEPRDGRAWKRPFKKLGWPLLYSLADQVVVSSNAARALIISMGIPEQKVTLTPLTVDNDWWGAQAEKADRGAVRAAWGANSSTFVVLFCAKLQPWKRPLDLLRAFAQANLPDALLVYAGEGTMRHELEQEATTLGIGERVRFLGFLNQSQLPAVYTAADLMVLPSENEPFAVVVNEASCCGCPVVASDHVGAAKDLIAPVDPGLIYPTGDLRALSTLLSELCRAPGRLRELGRAAKGRMASWSPQDTAAGTAAAVGAAINRRKPASGGGAS